MLCLEVRRDLSAFLDAELDAARRQEMEAHFAACCGCREYCESLHATETAMVEEHRRVVAPEALRQRIRLELDRTARTAGRGRLRWGLSAVAAAALVALMFLFLPQNHPSEAATMQVKDLVRLHEDLSNGSLALPCKESDLEAIRRFLCCSCKFEFCTHDLREFGLVLKGAMSRPVSESGDGAAMAFTPYSTADGRTVTHLSVARDCLLLQDEWRQREGDQSYYTVPGHSYRIVVFPNGDRWCIFIFGADQPLEHVIVNAIGG